MPDRISQHQSRRIVARLRVLTATGLLGIVTTLAVIGATLWQVRSERAVLSSEQHRLSHSSEQLRQFAAQSHAELESTLDGVEAQSDVGTATVNLQRSVQAELDARPDEKMIQPLTELKSRVDRLGELSNRAADWRDDYEAVNDDVRGQRTLGKVRGLIAELRTQIDSGDRLSEIARLTEVLAGEEQTESLIELRDKQINPALTDLAASIPAQENSASDKSPDKTVAQLRVAILGSSDPGGSVGLFNLRQNALALRREREKLKTESALLFENIDNAIAGFTQSAQGRTVALADRMELALTDGWHRTIVFGVLCCLSVFWLGYLISRGVYGQVNQIEEARAEAERGRLITQRLMNDQQAAAIELEAVHKKLLDTSRQAGMAEVATGVLHNVGNVLNSVNVSSTLITESIKKSRLNHLARIVTLFRDKSADLGTFITTDPAGKQIPGFLAQLSDFLASEQADCLKELGHLQKNIEHIKDIVSMQQAYACSSGFTEQVDLKALLEDALNINLAAMMRHDISVVREYGDAPRILADKHKILQIMVNLVSNAKHAMKDSATKTLTVRIESAGDDARVIIHDTGYGIAQENLTRIFNHGFTTKKGGHGFGLHSGAIAVKEAGGSMTVHSDGPGRGAQFTVTFPVAMGVAA